MEQRTEQESSVRNIVDEQNYKAHAENGVHYLTDFNPAPIGVYYGFIVTGESTVISFIAYLDAARQSGDITAITLVQGMYFPIGGNFSTITITAGDLMLLKQNA